MFVLFSKHDNNPQIPNNVIVNLQKKKKERERTPVFTILVSIKMSNFHESSVCVFCFGCTLTQCFLWHIISTLCTTDTLQILNPIIQFNPQRSFKASVWFLWVWPLFFFFFYKLSSVQFLWAYVNCSLIFLFWSDWQPVWSSAAHVLFCIPWL